MIVGRFHITPDAFISDGHARYLKGCPLAVMLAIRMHGGKSRECFPEVTTICEEMGYGVEAVQEALRVLTWSEQPYIKRTNTKRSNLYSILDLPELKHARPPKESKVARQHRSRKTRLVQQSENPTSGRPENPTPAQSENPTTNNTHRTRRTEQECTPLPLNEAVDQTSLIEIDSPGNSTAQSKKYEYDPDYLVFYEAYPRKAGKRAGEKAYKAWRKKRVYSDAQGLLKLLAPYIASWIGKSEEFIPHPGSWINTMPWDQEPPKPPGSVVTEQAVESDDANYLYATEVPLDMIDVETDAIVGEMIRDPARDSDMMDSASYDMHIDPMRGIGRTDDGSIIIAFPKNDDAWHAEREYLDHMTDLLGHKPKLTCVYWEMQKRKDGVDA